MSVFTHLFGPNGLVVNSESVLPDGSTHSAHFNGAFQSNFTQFNIALASQLTSLPLPSPASGFTYRFDPATGTFVRSTPSFGPILTERAETIGRGRFSFGFTHQFFSFDRARGNRPERRARRVHARRLPARRRTGRRRDDVERHRRLGQAVDEHADLRPDGSDRPLARGAGGADAPAGDVGRDDPADRDR